MRAQLSKMTGRCRGSGCTILGYVHPVSWIRVHYPGVCTPGVVDLDALSWGVYTRCRGSGCTTLGYLHPVSWTWMHYPGVRAAGVVDPDAQSLGCVHPVSWIRMYYPGVRTPGVVDPDVLSWGTYTRNCQNFDSRPVARPSILARISSKSQ